MTGEAGRGSDPYECYALRYDQLTGCPQSYYVKNDQLTVDFSPAELRIWRFDGGNLVLAPLTASAKAILAATVGTALRRGDSVAVRLRLDIGHGEAPARQVRNAGASWRQEGGRILRRT